MRQPRFEHNVAAFRGCDMLMGMPWRTGAGVLRFFSRFLAPSAVGLALSAVGAIAFAVPLHAAADSGKSGLQVPRFVSLKAGRVNVRVGPGEDYKIAWVFTRVGLPIEVIQEYDTWRRVRDSDGAVGWVFNSLLSGKRTAVVTPWGKADAQPLHADAAADAAINAYLEPGVMATVDRCRSGWCRITGKGFDGWIEQDRLWGVYPNEDLD
jgi:SH3-like domain-containing protein